MAENKQNKRPNVPPLRFPEFTEPWETTKLGKLTTKVGSGSTPRGGNSVYTDSGRCFVRSQNVGMGILLLNDIAHIDEKTHHKQASTEIKEKDVLLNITGASIGRTAVANKQLAGGNVNQHVCIIRPNDKLNSDFLCNYIQTRKIQNYINSLQTGGSREGLNFQQVRSFPINVPLVSEQTKISRLLSIIDYRIATQSKLIEQLESLIKGIIHHLTAESPNVRIADCLDCHSSTLQENQLKELGKCRVYGANGVCGYTDSPAINGNAILIVKDGSGVGNVSFATGEYSVIGTSNYLTAKSGYNLRYIYFCLMNFNFAPYKTGMAIPHIYFKDYGKAKIYCPALEEQERIANVLSKIERKMVIERSITNHYIEQKQYLLQQMFI